MTTDRHPSDDQPIQDEDDLFVVDDGKDGLDDAFSAVEAEVARSKQQRGTPTSASASEADEPRRPRAPADDFAIDDVDDVFVIADDGEDWLTGEAAPTPDGTMAPAVAEARDAAPEESEDHTATEPSRELAAPLMPQADEPASAFAEDDEPLSIQAESESLSEEDSLFAAPPPVQASESFIRTDVFRDNGESPRRFGGHEMAPEDMGINTSEESESSDLESGAFGWEESGADDLEIVDGASSETEPELGSQLGQDEETDEAEPPQSSEQLEGDSGAFDDAANEEEVFAVVEGDPAEQFGIAPTEDDDVSAPASGVWAGSESAMLRARSGDHSNLRDADGDAAEADAEEVDPIYGEGAAAAEAEAAPAEAEEPDYSEYEENYVASAQAQTPVVIGAPTLRRPRRRLAAFAAAALVLLGVGGGVAYMQPEWLGLDSGVPLIEKVAISKPVVSIDVEAPTLPQGQPQPDPDKPVDPNGVVKPVDPPVKVDPPVDPPAGKDDPVVKVDPPVVTDPVVDGQKTDGGKPVDPPPDPAVVGDPTSGQNPVKVDPTPDVPTNPGVDPAKDPSKEPRSDTPTGEPVVVQADPIVSRDDPAEQVVRVGEDLQVGRAEAPTSRSRVHHLADGLATGSQTFAQLKNMNYFLGRVKAMDSSFLTLDLAPGEITLAFDDLNALVPLASDEYREMQGSADGYVRLRNRNRLFGKVLNNSLADNIVLEVQKSQVVIPRATVEEVASQGRIGVQVPHEENADWIKAILQREAQTKPQPTVTAPDRAAAPPGGAPPSTPSGK